MPSHSPIAIVGMACRLPGAPNLSEYWRLLCEGRSSLGPMPEDRLDRRLHFDPEGLERPGGPRMGTTYTDLAGVIEPTPDDAANGLLPDELAAACDPTHVTFCQVAAEAVRSAGWDPHKMPTRRGGVYVGHTRGTVVAGQLIYGTLAGKAAEWLRECPAALREELGGAKGLDSLIGGVVDQVRSQMPARQTDGSPHLDAHYVASLASQALGFEGPAMAVNAACASSLIAMSMGVNALERGKLDCVVVGGASHCKLDSLVLFSKAQSASATGSRPFDDAADGLVAAEGYVALVLKKLDRAVADGDPIWAVVRGIGVSSDGKGKSLWAPRQEGQVEAIRRAYPEDLGPDAIDYIEAHATSTQVGDATELAALDEVFSPHRLGRGKLPIGTAKGNVGHTLETAGMAGLVKAVLAMRAGAIPPAVNLEKLNQKVDWESLSLEVARELTPWPDSREGAPPRCAAVNAFGIGGLNAHVVLQDRVDESLLATAPKPLACRPSDRGEDRRIAIVGASILAPGALSLDDYGELLRSGESQFEPLAIDRWGYADAVDPVSRRAHHAASELGATLRGWQYDWKRHRVPPKQIAAADPLQFMLLDAVDTALQDAGLGSAGKPSEGWNRRTAAVMIGSDFLGDFSADLQLAVRLPHLLDTIRQQLAARGVVQEAIEQVLNEYAARFVEHNTALLDETGSFTTSTLASRISKTYDLMGGAAAVDAGDASAAALLDIATDWLLERRCDSLICAAGQRALGLFSFERLSLLGRLRGADGQGFLNPGEGAGVVVLKRLADARADGDRVRAVIDDVAVDRAEEPRVASKVTQTVGHWGGASGMAELLASITNPTPDEPTVLVHGGGGQRYTLLTSQTAGADAATEPTRGSGVPSTPSKEPSRSSASPPPRETIVVRLSAPTPGGLASKCRAWAERLERSSELEHAWLEMAAASLDKRHAERLVFVTASPADAIKKLRLAGQGEETTAGAKALIAKGVLRRRASGAAPVVAWCFAGQGSQYPGMLRSFVNDEPSAKASVESIDRTFINLSLPSWTTIAWHEGDQLGGDVLGTKLAVLGADWLLADQLLRRGLQPTFVSGHSFGEYAALAQAGAWDWQDATRAAISRANAVVAHGVDGTMLCTDADAKTTERVCQQVREETGLGVYLANHNSPKQSVIGGEQQAVEAVAEQLKAEGRRVIPIPVPRPYHTPLLQRSREPLAAELRGIAMRPAVTPVLSSVSNRYEADPERLRENLVQQMTTPVRYVDLIERLRADRVDLIVEVGPGKVLTNLHRAILDGEGPLVVSTDDKQLGVEASLKLVEAAYDVLSPLVGETAPELGGSPPPETQASNDSRVLVTQPATSLEFELKISESDRRRVDVLELGSTPREIGFAHGQSCRDALRAAAERIADAAGGQALPALGPLADSPEDFFGPDDWDELIGLSEGSGVALSSVAACNLYAYPDLSGLGGCCHFTSQDTGGAGVLHAANEDLPLSLIVPPLRRRVVQWRRPSEGLHHVTFSAAGQLGGIAGMNTAGLSVSSAMLLDRPRPDDAPAGLLHGVLVRQALRFASNTDEALALFQAPHHGKRGAGGWAVLLSDNRSDDSILIEYDADEIQVHRGKRLLATNHAQLLTPTAPTPQHSRFRQERLDRIADSAGLGADPVARAKAVLRDGLDGRLGRVPKHRTMNTLCRLDNQLSVVMRPATKELWVHAADQQTSDGYVKLQIRERTSDSKPQDNGPTNEARSTATSRLTAETYTDAIHAYESPSNRVCDRFVVRVVESKALATAESAPFAAGLVVGNECLKSAIAKQLGGTWQRVGWGELAGEALRHLAAGPVGVVIDPQGESSAVQLGEWFSVVQRLIAEADEKQLTDRLHLLFLSQRGGSYGLSSPSDQPTADPLAGLAKAIVMEYRAGGLPTPGVVALDTHPDDDAGAIATAIAKLIRQPAGASVEWGKEAGDARLAETRIVPAPLSPTSNLPSMAEAECWVVTGGARGVTALAAERLASERNATVHLIGSTELKFDPAWLELDEQGLAELKKQTLRQAVEAGVRPPLSAWTRVERVLEVARNLQRMRSRGLDVHYHACDIRDSAAVAACLDRIRAQGKPVVGVVHGAGFERSCRFSRKQPADVERTLSVKLSGLDALVSALANDPLKWFLCFGSTAGRFGSVGQADYALANDVMARRMTVLRAQRPDCRWACFHWTAWGDVGMAMRQEVLTTLTERGIALMPAAEGVDHLLAEINSDSTDTEVVITDGGRFKQLVADDPLLAREEKVASSETAFWKKGAVTRRYTLRLQERTVPSAGQAPQSRPRRALLLGAPVWSQAFADRLSQHGADCLLIDSKLPHEKADEAIRQFSEADAIDCVFLLPSDDESSTAAAIRMLQCVQSWVRSGLSMTGDVPALRVAAVTCFDGNHGLGDQAFVSKDAGVVGAIKSLVVELHERGHAAKCVAIDVAEPIPNSDIVDRVLQEVSLSNGSELEIALGAANADARRLVYVESPLGPDPMTNASLPSGDWIVTGGARGVTCEATIEVARRFGLRLHLIGSSDVSKLPANWQTMSEDQRSELKKQVLAEAVRSGRREPPLRAWERLERAGEVVANLNRFRDAGVEARYYVCDLTDSAAIAQTVGQITAVAGSITGLMHGAGFEKSADLLKKQHSDMERTIRIKVDAFETLLASLPRQELKHVVAFGSISGRLGGLGQIDYCLANDALAKRVHALRSETPHLLATTFDWHSWDGVGMAVRPETQRIKAKLGITHMSIAEGVGRLVEELEHGLPEKQVLITTPEHLQRMGQQATQVETHRALGTDSSALLEPARHAADSAGTALTYEMPLDPVRDPFLAQHRFKDRPLLPLVIGIEAMLQACKVAAAQSDGQSGDTWPSNSWELTDIEVAGPLRFSSDQLQTAEVGLSPIDGGWQAELTSRFRNPRGQVSPKARRHFTTRVSAAENTEVSTVAVPSEHEIAGLRDLAIRDDLVLYHGPVFRMVEQINVEGSSAIALIRAPPAADLANPDRRAGGWVTSPAVLDACLFACGVQLFVSDYGAVSAPMGIDRLKVLGSFREGERLWLRLVNRSTTNRSVNTKLADEARFDFVLHDEQGKVRLLAEGYRATIVVRSALPASDASKKVSVR